jgi:hypothetical protein
MAKQEIIVDFSSQDSKARLWSVLRSCRGKVRVEMCQHRPRRTDRQNRYYWPCFVMPFCAFLKEQGDAVTDTDAHEVLKGQFLRDTKTIKGRKVEYVRSTTKLSTSEFNEYLDQCAAFLASYCDIIVPSPDLYHEREMVA